MRDRRFHSHGLFLALLALMVQLGSAALGSAVAGPRLDPAAVGAVLCHADDDTGGTPLQTPPPQAPPHCLVCPLCSVPHARMVALLPPAVVIVPPGDGQVIRPGLSPPSTAPPALHRFASQPRAPPTHS